MLRRIVITWAVAILCAWLFRTVVPPIPFPIVVIKGSVAYGYDHFNRVASWLCILIAIVLSIRPTVRLFLQDFPFYLPR